MCCFRPTTHSLRNTALLCLLLLWISPAIAQTAVPVSAAAPCGRGALALKPRVDVATESLNVRSAATSQSTRITTIQAGQQFAVVGFAPGQPIAGDDGWLLLQLDQKNRGWVSGQFVIPAEEPRLPPAGLQASDPNLYASPGKRQRDGGTFWPYRFYWSTPVSNGGCPGFVSGDPADFDPQLANEQMHVLAEEYDIDMVISLACREHMTALAKRMSRRGEDVPEQESIRLWVNDRYYPKNRATFLRLGELAQERRLYIHCRHGSHRAVVATMAALIAADRVSSLEDALLQARGHLESFRPGYARPLFRHVVRFALERGIDVAPKYLDFAGMSDEQEVSHAP